MSSTDEVAAATERILDVLGVDDPDATMTVHAPDNTARAAALDEHGTVLGVELIDDDNHPRRDGVRFVTLDDDEPIGAGWTLRQGQWHAPTTPATITTAPDPSAQLRRDVDVLLQLVLTSQDGVADDVTDVAAALAGMAERGALTRSVIDGAFGWAVITSNERASLLDRLTSTGAGEEDEPG